MGGFMDTYGSDIEVVGTHHAQVQQLAWINIGT